MPLPRCACRPKYGTDPPGFLREILQRRQRQTELGATAAGADLFMMAAPITRIQPQPQVTASEQFRPVPQRIDTVERDPDIVCQRGFVFGTRGEARGEQHPGRVQPRQRVEDVFDFARRDAFKPKPQLPAS